MELVEMGRVNGGDGFDGDGRVADDDGVSRDVVQSE